MAPLAAARRPYTDCFPSILFESQSALLQPRRFMHSRRLDRKRERESVAVDIFGCGDRILMHFACVCVRVVKICELMVPSPCRCSGFGCRPLAQFAICGMCRWTVGVVPDLDSPNLWVKTSRIGTCVTITSTLVYLWESAPTEPIYFFFASGEFEVTLQVASGAGGAACKRIGDGSEERTFLLCIFSYLKQAHQRSHQRNNYCIIVGLAIS